MKQIELIYKPNKEMEKFVDPKSDFRSFIDQRMAVRKLKDIFDFLPEEERDVIIEMYVKEKGIMEAARFLDIHHNTISLRKYKALTKLRRHPKVKQIFKELYL